LEVAGTDVAGKGNHREELFKMIKGLEAIDGTDKDGNEVESTIYDEDEEGDFEEGDDEGEFDDEEGDFEDDDDFDEEEEEEDEKPQKGKKQRRE
jgi:hypothetical protein